eukprot:605725-Lingulodinium_polyedra.AAC.1
MREHTRTIHELHGICVSTKNKPQQPCIPLGNRPALGRRLCEGRDGVAEDDQRAAGNAGLRRSRCELHADAGEEGVPGC